MSKILVTRGLPASGKSTFAREWAEERPTRARVNRDDLRHALYGRYDGLTRAEEQAVTAIETEAVSALLKADKDVVVDAMHLRPRYVRKWETLAREVGAEFEVKEFEISIEESLSRNGDRMIYGERFVRAGVVRGMRKWLTKDEGLMPYEPLPEVAKVEVEKYVADETKPGAIIVDIDGTLALHNGRNPYDLSRVHEDSLCEQVATAVSAASIVGYQLIFLSGREDSAERATRRWLYEKLGFYDSDYRLFMRKAGDGRKDTIVKRELFDEHVRHNYNVHAVIDDRPSVCRMWRELGLFTFQVGDPHVEF